MKASEYVRKGWCQGAAARDIQGNALRYDDPKAVQWCLLAAATLAFEEQKPCVSITDKRQRQVAAMQRALNKLGPKLGKDISIPDWNDQPKRTQADVIAVLEQHNL